MSQESQSHYLTSLTPLDGRYHKKTDDLKYFLNKHYYLLNSIRFLYKINVCHNDLQNYNNILYKCIIHIILIG